MRSARTPNPLFIVGREAMAFARQAWLLRHDLVDPVVPRAVGHDEDVVVFLHGLFASAGVLRPLRAAVTRHRGVHSAALSYPPGPGVGEIAARLGDMVKTLPRSARIHLVGHSLGGIVARHFAHESGDDRIAQTISLASPFGGVPHASWLGFEGARDLDPDSPLLRSIRLKSSTVPVPHLSIIAGADSLVKSPVAHALPGGEVLVLAHRGHNTLLFDEETGGIVERRVLARRRALQGDPSAIAAE